MSNPLRLSFGLPFRDAVAAAEARNVVLPDDYYGHIPDTARATATTISKLTQLTQIREVIDSLNQALGEGKSLAQWRREVLANWPGDGELPTKAYLAMVFRTNAQTAYTAGLWRQFQANRANRMYLMYSAINDSRTRPAHRAMSGYIAHIDDSIWQQWTPPCGFQCRCTLIALSAREAVDRGYGKQERPNVHPDPGFGAAVADIPDLLERQLADAVGKVPEEISSAIAAQADPPVLEDALRAALGGVYADVAAHVQHAAVLAHYTVEAIAIADFLRSQQMVTSVLRGDMTLDETATQGARVAALQQAAGVLPAFDGTTFRTVSASGFPPYGFERFLSAHKAGSIVQWQAPVLGTSASSEVGAAVQFTIRATRALDVRALAWRPGDPEVLFVAGATFRVLSAKQVEGKPWRWEVELEEVEGVDPTLRFATDALTVPGAQRFKQQHGETPWAVLERAYPQFREANQRLKISART